MKNNLSLDDISIRTELRPGDIGYVIYMHGSYKKEYNYGNSSKRMLPKAYGFWKVQRQRDRVWVCEHNGK
jgi:peptidyl-dipeptidase Dcp